jgi:PIN domain nuclease of toxin-antitoxin system
MALLLDTCAAIWFAEDQPILGTVSRLMDRAAAEGEPVYVSPVTAWEIGNLASRGRLNLQIGPQQWFEQLMQRSGARVARISPSILIASSFLPGRPPKDPADRIFAATAREYNWPLVTRDRLLLEYAAEGHIQALAC